MTQLVLGVIGHVDHGKTALVRALTGMDTDRLPEEKQRGISIALGFAHVQIDANTQVDLIDMPGHERFVRTMIAGATGIDAVLLVVAANEGVKPQTVEHVDIAGLLGLRRAVIAITKSDLVTKEEGARVADDAVRLLTRSGLSPLPPVMTSSVEHKGFDELRQTLGVLASEQRERAVDGRAFLPIDRAFSIAGHGPVVTGTLRGAVVSAGDALELWPARRSVRVRAVQVHSTSVTTALPGQRVALNLRDVEVAELRHGMALAAPDSIAVTEWLTIAICAVSDAPLLQNGMRLRALLGTSELDVRLRLLDRDVLEAGQSGFAQLHCAEPVAVPAREHVVLRLTSPSSTVAGGRILETDARRLRRHSASILQRLEDVRALPSDAVLAAEIYRAGAAGTTLRHLCRLSALATARVVDILQGLPVSITRSETVVRNADLEKLISRASAMIAAHATGLSRDKLLAALPETSLAVLDEVLARLLADGTIIERGKQFLPPQPDEDRARAQNELELAATIAETLRRAGLTPPNPGAIVTSPQTKRAVDRLLRERIIVRTVDRAKGREMLFHREAIEDAQRRLAPLLDHERGLLVTEIGAALGISRKYSMPLLDHLDTIRFTRRIDDRRIRA